VILPGVDASHHHRLMELGIWPEPHAEVVAAHEALAESVWTNESRPSRSSEMAQAPDSGAADLTGLDENADRESGLDRSGGEQEEEVR